VLCADVSEPLDDRAIADPAVIWLALTLALVVDTIAESSSTIVTAAAVGSAETPVTVATTLPGEV
jgi:hypothetical protein